MTDVSKIQTIQIPELALVALIGASSAGKSTFAAQHFKSSEVLGSDFFRLMVSDSEHALDANAAAFDSLFHVVGHRLSRGLLTVIDATSVRHSDRQRIIDLARQHDVLPVAIVLDLPKSVLKERHRLRTDRPFRENVVLKQYNELHRNKRGLHKQGFRHVWTLSSVEEVEQVQVQRVPLYNNKADLKGPFDFIGDVHGCLDELQDLLIQLGYKSTDASNMSFEHPEGRTAVFVGDLVDRGPNSVGVLRLVMQMVENGSAFCVVGNHDEKLKQALAGKAVQARHGLDVTLQQLESMPETDAHDGKSCKKEFKKEVQTFISKMISHLIFDEGKVLVAHAGLPERYQGRSSKRVRSFALYGDVDGSTDALGFPVRRDWASEYRGRRLVVYGHTPVAEPRWFNNTVNIDTGCVFGGALTALRYPELQTVSVAAKKQYAKPAKPLCAPMVGAIGTQNAKDQMMFDQVVFLQDGKIHTKYLGQLFISKQQRAAAIETFARHGVDPRVCPYLPPTMSPAATSERDGFLEHPDEAFGYYRAQGVEQVICQEKHMGSRAILLLGRHEESLLKSFGVADLGCIYTRTGRPFFGSTWKSWESDILKRARAAAEQAGLWQELETDWLLLDAEILPWSLKAEELIKRQYAAVAAAGETSLQALQDVVAAGIKRGLAPSDLPEQRVIAARLEHVRAYRAAYRAYVKRIDGPEDVQIRPFHLLASAGRVHSDKNHLWHLEQLARLQEADGQLFGSTDYRVVSLSEPLSKLSTETQTPTTQAPTTPAPTTQAQAEQIQALQWWQNLTATGGEGMVVKPLDFLPHKPKIQPALKVRGSEYLRIIYGPEYLQPEHLQRLRSRALGAKRGRAIREFALGLQALEHVVAGYAGSSAQVHECVLGVLALEAQPIDARL